MEKSMNTDWAKMLNMISKGKFMWINPGMAWHTRDARIRLPGGVEILVGQGFWHYGFSEPVMGWSLLEKLQFRRAFKEGILAKACSKK